ncbi:MAG: PKD domain-containing protein [Candidatus Brocadiia bacterium]
MRTLALVVAAALCATPAWAARLRVRVRNSADVDRVDAPVTSGVPWPRGLLESTDQMRLLDRLGEERPLQVEVLSRWPDGSIKWTLFDFQASVPAKGSTTYFLDYGPGVRRQQRAAQAILVEDGEDYVMVLTGAARFRIAKQGFNLLDQVTLHGHSEPIVRVTDERAGLRLVPSEQSASFGNPGQETYIQLPPDDRVYLGRHAYGPRWLRQRGFRLLDEGTGEELDVQIVGASLDPEGRRKAMGHGWCKGVFLQLSRKPGRYLRVEYPRAADRPLPFYASLGSARVDVETKGPLRSVVRAMGRLRASDGRRLCDYVARLHFYAGKAQVRVQLTVFNRENLPRSQGLELYPLLVDDLSLALPLELGRDLSFAFTGPLGYGASHRGRLKGEGDEAKLVQFPAPAQALARYVVTHGGEELAAGGRAEGGAALRDEEQGVVVCVRDLWANNPKALRVNGRGRVEVGLLPAEAGPCEEFVAGRAKTHDVLLAFHGEAAPSLLETAAAFDEPPTATLAPGLEGEYRGRWAANTQAVALAPLSDGAHDIFFRRDYFELQRTRDRTGSLGMWRYGGQGVARCRVAELVVEEAEPRSLQAVGLVGMEDAEGRALVVATGKGANVVGRAEQVVVAESDPGTGQVSFAKPLPVVPAKGARVRLYDPWGQFLCHRYDLAYAIAREYLRHGEPRLLHAAHASARHLSDVVTFHNIQGAGEEWTGACQDPTEGLTSHHVPGLSPEGSWYAGGWLTFLLTGDRAILRTAYENAAFAARRADRPGTTALEAALAVINLSFATEVASALSPDDAPVFQAALEAYASKLLQLQDRTQHGLYADGLVPAGLALEALAMYQQHRRDERVAPSVLRAAEALVRPDRFWSGHNTVGQLQAPDGSRVKPYGTADGLVLDRTESPEDAIYGPTTALVFPHLAWATELSGDGKFIKKARRLERVATLFTCLSFEDFALRYRRGDVFATAWQRYVRTHPPAADPRIGLQCRLENAADVAMPDIGTGGSVVGCRFVALPDGSRALQAQAPDVEARAGVGAWFPLAGSGNIRAEEGAIEFRILYRKGPDRTAGPWVLSGAPRRHGFSLGITGEGLEFRTRIAGGAAVRHLMRGVAVQAGTWHHVALRWRPNVGVDVFFDGRQVLLDRRLDRIGYARRLRIFCNPDDQANEYLIDDLRIWKQAPKAFAAVDDRTPPAAIEDLRLEPARDGRMLLSWTAPGDDGKEGRARRYDIRISTQGFGPLAWGGYAHTADPLAAVHWAEADRVAGPPEPQPPGRLEKLRVGPFPEGRRIYIAVKTEDEANVSSLSNVVHTPVNHPPVADAGPPLRQVIAGTEVAFDASASSDPDYDPLTFSWSNGVQGIAGPRRYPDAGEHEVVLTVSDGQAEAKDTVRLMVGDTVRISFQPRGSEPPAGFIASPGAVYAPSRGFGWRRLPRGAATFDRRGADAAAPQARTGIYLPRSAEWLLDLPNGAYVLTLAVGDPGRPDGVQRVFAEGQEIVSVDLGGKALPHVAADKPVTVEDGQLTLTIGVPAEAGGPAAGEGGAISYIVVQRAP